MQAKLPAMARADGVARWPWWGTDGHTIRRVAGHTEKGP